jgi:hypothetical protein
MVMSLNLRCFFDEASSQAVLQGCQP